MILAATRTDLDVLGTGYASLIAQSFAGDCVVLLADALPGEAPATGAPQLTAFDLVGRARAFELGYSSPKTAFVAALMRLAVAGNMQRYRRVVALPPRALIVGSLQTLFELLESGDVEADAQAPLSWIGRRRGNDSTRARQLPGDELAASAVATPQAAVVLLPAAAQLARLPAVLAASYARHHQPGHAQSYRFDSFSNGVHFDSIARTLYADARAAGQTFADPGDVYADPSFFHWLRAPDGRGSPYLRGYIAHHELQDAPAEDADVADYLRSIQAPDLDPIWLLGSAPSGPRRQTVESLGVNVAGFFRAEAGIGEAGRSMAKALALAGEPLALLDYSDLTFSRTDDKTYAGFGSAAPHPITLLCMNPPQYGALKARAAAGVFGTNSYRIGNWWWELPDLPPDWFAAFADIDELWVGSRFIFDTVKPVSPVPVFYIPPIVDPVLMPPVDRREFDLDPATTVFLATFDYNSVAERKNPLAVIDAFQRAFRHAERVCLLVKTMNADLSPPAAGALEAAAGDDGRIRFLNHYLDRFGVARLFASCDAYVSLHRSEGFGLGIAEAMAYGKPVVTTAWSGNMDFTTAQNSYLVDYELVTLQTDHGPYFSGSTWAQPDVDHAAYRLGHIYHDPAQAQRRGSRARYDIRSRFAPARVATYVRARIDRIQTTVLQKAVTIP